MAVTVGVLHRLDCVLEDTCELIQGALTGAPHPQFLLKAALTSGL